MCRTTPDVSCHMKRLDFKVREVFIPCILDRVFSCSDIMRRMLALPCRFGGLSIHNLSETSDLEYEFSQMVTKDLSEAIYKQASEFKEDREKLAQIKSEVSRKRQEFYQQQCDNMLPDLTEMQKLQLDLASEKGASSWLTALPLQKFGYVLNKQQFTDAIALRYNLNIKNVARACVCQEPNTINHLLICKLGGYVTLRHNSLRDLIAELLQNAGCKDVTVEPHLLPVQGVQLPNSAVKGDDARLDVSARSIWNPLERAFLDIRVFHPLAPSNKAHGTISSMYKSHETQKKAGYNARVLEVERGTFMLVVFSTTGGMGNEANTLFKRIAQRTASKTGQRYSDVMSFIRKRVRFDLLKTTIIALRGHRGRRMGDPVKVEELDMNLEPVESQ